MAVLVPPISIPISTYCSRALTSRTLPTVVAIRRAANRGASRGQWRRKLPALVPRAMAAKSFWRVLISKGRNLP